MVLLGSAILIVGGIITVTGSEILDQTLEYLSVFMNGIESEHRGHITRTGEFFCNIYLKHRNYWYLTWTSLFAMGWLIVVLGTHLAMTAIIERHIAEIILYWPVLFFAVLLGIVLLIDKLRTVKRLRNEG